MTPLYERNDECLLKRDCSILLRFTREELDALTEKASRTNYSREEFCRRILNGCTLKEAPPVEYYALIREVKRLGSNINQLLVIANARGYWQSRELRAALDEYHHLVALLWDAFSNSA